MNRILRFATEQDAAALRGIYAESIETAITFEDVLPSLEEFQGRIREIQRFYPYYLCEIDGEIVGYAYAHQMLERAAYRWNVELTVYVQRARLGVRVGSTLYATLLETLKRQKFRNAYALITVPNPASENMQRAFGFERIGVLPHTGFKSGAWRDVAYFAKTLDDDFGVPDEPISIRNLETKIVAEILDQANRK